MGEKPEWTLIMFSNQTTFQDLEKDAYVKMLHFEVKIQKSSAVLRLPDNKDVSKNQNTLSLYHSKERCLFLKNNVGFHSNLSKVIENTS